MQLSEFFYYYGFIYIADNIYTVINYIINKDKIDNKRLPTNFIEFLKQVSYLGFSIFLISTAWVICGALISEQPINWYFSLLLFIGVLLVLIRVVFRIDETPMWYITKYLRITIASLILYQHFLR